VCAAFHGAVPLAIVQNAYDHRTQWIDPDTGEPGDTGVRGGASLLFEPRASVPRDMLNHLYDVLDRAAHS
jgi:hypothetical protein